MPVRPAWLRWRADTWKAFKDLKEMGYEKKSGLSQVPAVELKGRSGRFGGYLKFRVTVNEIMWGPGPVSAFTEAATEIPLLPYADQRAGFGNLHRAISGASA